MFVLSTQDNAMFRGIATVVTIALVLYAVGTAYVRTASADNLTDVYDLLSSSATSTVSNHTIQFVTPTGVAAGETITVTFEAGFNLTSIIEDDVDIATTSDLLTDTAPSGATWGVVIAGQIVTFTSGTDVIAAGATVTIEIGDHATADGTGSFQIVNPGSQTSYEIDIAGTMYDSGHTRVAIVDSVYVTASVDTIFNFTVAGFGTAAGIDVNGATTTVAGTSTATTLEFGTLTESDPVLLAQLLNVSTNAINGFVVTVETDQQLLSSTGAIIDGYEDGAYTDTPQTWTQPGGGSPNVDNDNEWGHWGLTSDDSDLNGGEFSAGDVWITASTTPRSVFSHDGPAIGQAADKGSTTVGYKIEISALQEAGDDYEAILTYIATPTF